MKNSILFTLTLLFFLSFKSYACTSAIFTGKVTADGRPLLWKNRDTDTEDDRIDFYKGPIYDFLALVDSYAPERGAWIGTNSAGFSIMNTASYNLKEKGDTTSLKGMEGILMYEALGTCATLSDFEKFLDTHAKPFGSEANFGVIDAHGGAAFYEVNNFKWVKYDVNDPSVAPEGWMAYTNFSRSGRKDEGMGYIRYDDACMLIRNKLASNTKITPLWIFSGLSRSFYNSVLGTDALSLLKKDVLRNGWTTDDDIIPRRITAASVVVKGVNKGEDPSDCIMWAALGYPPASVAVPVMVKYGNKIPFYVTDSGHETAFMCDLSKRLKNNIFSLKKGNGKKYLKIGLLVNDNGTGYMQLLGNTEYKIFGKAEALLQYLKSNSGRENKSRAVVDFYSDIFSDIRSAYSECE